MRDAENNKQVYDGMVYTVAIWDLGFAAQCTQTIELDLGKTRD